VATLAGCSAATTPASGRAGAGGATTAISFNAAQCGGHWRARPGAHTFLIKNDAGAAAEVNLINPADNAIYGLLEAIGPETTGTMAVDLGSGRYAFQCVIDDIDPFTGPTVQIPGHAKGTPGIVPVTDNDLLQPEKEYHAYVTIGLNQLTAQTKTLAGDIKAGKLTAARAAWLTAHLSYERLGAAYGTFGDFDGEIDGRADGLPDGVRDPGFTGFYRVEYGLWHGQSAKELTNPVDQLAGYVQSLRNAFPDMEIDLLDIGLRTHEILENAVQFQLSGNDDYGSGTTLATTAANIIGTRELLTILRPLLVTRYGGLPGVYVWLNRLTALLNAQHHPGGGWTPVTKLSTTAREQIDAAAGQALTELAPIAAITEPRRI
jgi:iron uptake system EfeUOB component EfeO/EfeM